MDKVITVKRTPSAGVLRNKTIKLHPCTTGKALDIDVAEEGKNSYSGTIGAQDAIALRDALIDIYPLPAAPESGVMIVSDPIALLEAFDLGRCYGKAPLPATGYNEKSPKLGDKVQVKKTSKGLSLHLDSAPLPLTVIDAGGDFVTVCDASGETHDGWFPTRFETYVPPPATSTVQATKATVPSPKWETVVDGLDRVKVPGGWIYQSEAGEQTFVPEPNGCGAKDCTR